MSPPRQAFAGEGAAVDRLLAEILASDRRMVVELDVGEAIERELREVVPIVGAQEEVPGIDEGARVRGARTTDQLESALDRADRRDREILDGPRTGPPAGRLT